MADEVRTKDRWDKFRIGATGFSLLLVPFVVAALGYWIEGSIKRDENRQRTLEVAIDILREDPEEEETNGLREWAVDVVSDFSEVPLSDNVREELLNRSLPLTSRLPAVARIAIELAPGRSFSTRECGTVTLLSIDAPAKTAQLSWKDNGIEDVFEMSLERDAYVSKLPPVMTDDCLLGISAITEDSVRLDFTAEESRGQILFGAESNW